MTPAKTYALSVKQPWAALILSGVKTLEIRSWSTARRGNVFIHAARVADTRDHAWSLVPDEATELAQLRGGIVGQVHLEDCVVYRSRDEFVRDRDRHCNDPEWWTGSVLYGFQFANPRIVRFRPLPGWFRFFSVPVDDSSEK